MEAAAPDSEELRSLKQASDGMTMREEYIDDAVAALRLVAEREEVDSAALFVLGHSLGALAAPAVVRTEGAPGVRGVIVMAGAGRPLDVLLEEQVAFQSRQAGMSEEQAAARARRHVAPLEGIEGEGVDPFKPILGATATYWRDVLKRELPAELRALSQPVLLLQGEKDIQVRVEDHEILKAALEARDSGSYRAHLFPQLNHLFIAISGRSTGAEYYDPGRVDPEVTRILAEWIRSIAG
jgi:pimeloyl-ACP methyl ester carboxylesterase